MEAVGEVLNYDLKQSLSTCGKKWVLHWCLRAERVRCQPILRATAVQTPGGGAVLSPVLSVSCKTTQLSSVQPLLLLVLPACGICLVSAAKILSSVLSMQVNILWQERREVLMWAEHSPV